MLGETRNQFDPHRWECDKGTPLDRLTIRASKGHLFSGNRALVGNATEYLAIAAHGTKQPNATKTGVLLDVRVEWSTSAALSVTIARNNRVFSTRVPFLHKRHFACNAFALLVTDGSYGDLCYRRKRPAVWRPEFTGMRNLVSSIFCFPFS